MLLKAYSWMPDFVFRVVELKELDFIIFFWSTGSSFGDPHITTLDGLTYTFNGLGEYVMLTMIEPTSNTTLLDIQTRTAQAINANGTLINATVFQAFAVQEKNGGQAMVEINLAKTGRV